MRLSRLHRPTKLGFNMTPMIDVVFLLLIFFMTVSQISRALDYPLELPEATAGGRPVESVGITINLDRHGVIMVGGKSLSLDQLSAALTLEIARVDQQVARLRVLVRCDRNSPGRYFNDLVHRLESVGIRQIRVSINVAGGTDGL
jgi:biopolymer transport protein ExbD